MSEDTLRFLNKHDKDLLLAKAKRIGRRRGEVLLKEGSQEHNLYLVQKGYVRVERTDHDHGVALARLGPGQVFGEMSFLEETGASASVLAEEDVEIDVVEHAYIQSVLTSDPGFSARFFQSLAVCMAHRLRETTRARSAGLLGEEAPLNRFHVARTGQITERQMPDGLVTAVGTFKGTLQTLAKELKAGQVTKPAAQGRVDEACNHLREVLDQYTDQEALLEIGYDDPLAFRDAPQLAMGIGGYVFRETFPLFMASATMARCYMKPHGYVEDRETLEMIYRNEPEGDGPLGAFFDHWFLSRPVCQSRRNALRRLTALLKQVTAGFAGAGPVRVTSLACGTAQELFDLLTGARVPLYATCIDTDADALLTTAALAHDRRLVEHITFLQADVVELARGRGRVDLGPQQLIYALNLCDYLVDEQVQALLDWIYEHLGEGGHVVLTNLDAAHPDRAFMEHILEWKVVGRTEERLRELFARSKFRDLPLTVTREEAGVGLVASCRKKK